MGTEAGGVTLPQTFRDLKSLVRIHLKQILKLDRITAKVPMNAVALLVVIAYEALSKYRHPRQDSHYLFAHEHRTRHHVPLAIGGAIFNGLRNGLAHRYEPYPIVVEGLGDIELELTWKDGAAAHLRGIAVRHVKGHKQFSPFPTGSTEIPRALCLNVESLWRDLDGVFATYELSLMNDAKLTARFEANVAKNRDTFTRTATGNAACEWRDFLAARRFSR